MQDPTTPSPGSGTTPDAPPSNPVGQALTPAADRGQRPAAEAAQATQSLAGEAKRKLTGTLDNQKGAAADFVQQLAQTVEQSGQQFAGKQDWIASAVGRGAAELNTLADELRNKDLGDLISQVQSFARAQPALFTGAALAAGFAVARLGRVVAADLSRDDLPTVPPVAQPTAPDAGRPTTSEVGQPTGPEVDHGH